MICRSLNILNYFLLYEHFLNRCEEEGGEEEGEGEVEQEDGQVGLCAVLLCVPLNTINVTILDVQ